MRPAMKRAFAAVSRDGTDNGWIESVEEFATLIGSVGARPARFRLHTVLALTFDRCAAKRRS